MPLINDSASLSALCAKLTTLPFVAVDTEFLRDKYYYPKLCLIQIGDATGQYLIDPLVPNLDLTPLIELFINPNIIKIFHSASQDIETFYHHTGKMIFPLYDTQIAAMALGYFSQTSYSTLVSDFLGKSLDKTSQFSEWDRRPLSDKQLYYAADDVKYLYMLYPLLQQKLVAQKREQWIVEETAQLLSPDTYITQPEDAWKRLSLRDRSPHFLGIIKELSAWREREAQTTNRPRTHILKDATLLDIAKARVKSIGSLQRIRQTSHLTSAQQQHILDTIKKGLSNPHLGATYSSPILSPEDKYIFDMYKILLYTISREHNIAERLLASSQDLSELTLNPSANIPAFSGWRHEIFGKYLKELQVGKLALRINKQKIELLS